METKCNVFEKLITSIVEGMEDCVNTWCSKKEISNISLLEWKTTESNRLTIKLLS